MKYIFAKKARKTNYKRVLHTFYIYIILFVWQITRHNSLTTSSTTTNMHEYNDLQFEMTLLYHHQNNTYLTLLSFGLCWSCCFWWLLLLITIITYVLCFFHINITITLPPLFNMVVYNVKFDSKTKSIHKPCYFSKYQTWRLISILELIIWYERFNSITCFSEFMFRISFNDILYANWCY